MSDYNSMGDSAPAEIGTAQTTAAPAPEEVRVDDLHAAPLARLNDLANQLRLRYNPERSRHSLIFEILRAYSQMGVTMTAEGVLELVPEGSHGFLRWPRYNFRPGPDDVFVSQNWVKQYGLRNGQLLSVRLRGPRDRERCMAVGEVLAIEGVLPAEWREPKAFDLLTAQFPTQRIILENNVTKAVSVRAVDLVAPLGRGQRALIVAAPRVGKTILMRDIAQGIRATSPETRVILLLIDERPEEVTDLRRTVDAEIYCSTFDETAPRHVQVAELVSDRAKRLVELGQHVVILLDSLTRLSRGYNNLQSGKGRIMSGGVDAKALLKPKKFFGAARNVEEGGSLTIVATALVGTESRMDEVIFEEFKGTGNMELHLDRVLAEKRVFPAIHILNSGTRREELLYHPDELRRVHILRKQLAQLPAVEAMEVLLQQLRNTRTNAELLLTGLR
jgi:transcription termination factor Rho